MKVLVTKRDVPCSLEVFLQCKLKFSKRFIRKLKGVQGCLQINGKAARVIDSLAVGDEVYVQFPNEDRSEQMVPENTPLTIVYEDEDLLILNKEEGIAMSPSLQHSSGTLANRIIHYYNLHKLTYTVHFVTRLDRDTSGLVIVAKHRHIHALLSKALENNEIIRTYEAIVTGNPKEPRGIINEPIARNPNSMIERMVDESGQEARTHYTVLKHLTGYSHISARLETGRTHQIRVHFAHIGNPLVGDTLYGGEINGMNEQALHCSMIEFTHPHTHEVLTFQSPLRNEMFQFIRNHR